MINSPSSYLLMIMNIYPYAFHFYATTLREECCWLQCLHDDVVSRLLETPMEYQPENRRKMFSNLQALL